MCILQGWHLDCMVPPLAEPPNGRWHCPECPPPYPEGQGYEPENIQPPEEVQQFQTHDREASVASSSRSALETSQSEPKGGAKGKRPTFGKGKAKPKVVMAFDDDEEDDSDDDAGEGAADESTSIVSRRRARLKSTKKGKARHESSEIEETPSSPIKQQQRKRKRPRESPPPQVHLPRVRLRLPMQKGKGKEREDDEPPHGLFDDILSVDERDTSKTTINKTDKFYFERSRVAAEVIEPSERPPDFLTFVPPGETRPSSTTTAS